MLQIILFEREKDYKLIAVEANNGQYVIIAIAQKDKTFWHLLNRNFCLFFVNGISNSQGQ